MKTAKIITICIGLILLVVIATIGILGIVGYIKITEGVAAGVIITPAIGIILAIVNAKHLFDDPEATTKLKDDHADAIRKMKEDHADVIAGLKKAEAEREKHVSDVAMKVHADYRETIAQKDATIALERERRAAVEKKLMPPPPRASTMFMAPGSAKTTRPPHEL